MAAVQRSTSTTLDRLANWYSENKIVAWTLAGVTVVVTGGTVFYLTSKPKAQASEKKSKKDKRKSKKKDTEKAAEEGTAAPKGKAGEQKLRLYKRA